MSIESDIRFTLQEGNLHKNTAEALSSIVLKLDLFPREVSKQLIAAKERYVRNANLSELPTLSYSPIRAVASYFEYFYIQPLKKEEARPEADSFVGDLRKGIAVIEKTLISTEDAIARGPEDQALFELRQETNDLPIAERKNFIEHNYGKRLAVLKKRMSDLIQDPHGFRLITEECKEHARKGDWNDINLQGGIFAVNVYARVYPKALLLFSNSDNIL